MSDARLNSGHFETLPRRQDYRHAREALLGARGWLTLAVENVHGIVEDSEDWPALPIRPDKLLPGAKFLLIDPQTGRTYPLQTGLNTIGRLPDNDIVFEEGEISRRHCVLLVHAWGGGELHDTASRNGTSVNGRRLHQPTRLNSGDRIQVCRRQLLFVSENDCSIDDENEDHPATVDLK